MFGIFFTRQYESVKMPKYLTCNCNPYYPSRMYVSYAMLGNFFHHQTREFVCENCQCRKLAVIKIEWPSGKQHLIFINIPPSLKRPGNVPPIHDHIIKRFR
jgi:hypothetical protein